MIDINDIRAWHTIVSLAVFIGIIVWAYSKRRKHSFEDAANLPFADEERHQATINKENLS